MPTIFWIAIAVGAVILVGSLAGRKNTAPKGPARIDHPHVIDPDDYECSVCHRRFRKNQMSCPYCGARFAGRVTDEDEFTEEEEELEAWDEEDGL